MSVTNIGAPVQFYQPVPEPLYDTMTWPIDSEEQVGAPTRMTIALGEPDRTTLEFFRHIRTSPSGVPKECFRDTNLVMPSGFLPKGTKFYMFGVYMCPVFPVGTKENRLSLWNAVEQIRNSGWVDFSFVSRTLFTAPARCILANAALMADGSLLTGGVPFGFAEDGAYIPRERVIDLVQQAFSAGRTLNEMDAFADLHRIYAALGATERRDARIQDLEPWRHDFYPTVVDGKPYVIESQEEFRLRLTVSGAVDYPAPIPIRAYLVGVQMRGICE